MHTLAMSKPLARGTRVRFAFTLNRARITPPERRRTLHGFSLMVVDTPADVEAGGWRDYVALDVPPTAAFVRTTKDWEVDLTKRGRVTPMLHVEITHHRGEST